MIGRLTEMTRLSNGEWATTFTTKQPMINFDELAKIDCDIVIKKYRKSRSNDANAFCWALCTQIGNALQPPIPKEMVYRRAIRDVGDYVPLPIRNDVVEDFKRRWSSKGIGWFAEVIDDSKIHGYKMVFAYYGSSTYDTKSMSHLIDYLIDEVQQMGMAIPLSKSEVERMKAEWRLQDG